MFIVVYDELRKGLVRRFANSKLLFGREGELVLYQCSVACYATLH